MIRHKQILGLTATALAFAFGSAQAAPTDAPSAPGASAGSQAQHQQWHQRAQQRFQHRLEQLHAQLNLSAPQEALWQTALTTMRNGHEAMRASRHQQREQMKAMTAQPVLDLAALRDAREQAAQRSHQIRKQTEDAWLQFYAALDTRQKVTVSDALKANWKRMEQRHAHMMRHTPGQPMGGAMQHGMQPGMNAGMGHGPAAAGTPPAPGSMPPSQ